MNRSILLVFAGILTSIGIFAQSGHIAGKIVAEERFSVISFFPSNSGFSLTLGFCR
jgi:hypothetical protein